MRIRSVLTAALFAALLTPIAANAELADLAGTWIQADEDYGGLPKLVLSDVGGGKLEVHVYGCGLADPCDLGAHPATLWAESVTGIGGPIAFRIAWGTVESGVSLDGRLIAPGYLRLTTFSSFGGAKSSYARSLTYVRDVATPLTWIVPAAARAAGAAGTFFRTDLRITNTDYTEATVDVRFLPNQDNTGISRKVFTIPRLTSLAFDDAVKSLLALEGGVGAISISSNRILEITSNTYTQNAGCGTGGTYGQFIPALPVHEASKTMFLGHLIHDAAFRTNVGVVNAGTAPAKVKISLRDADGTLRGSQFVDLGAFGWKQMNGFLPAHGIAETHGAWAEIESSGPVFAYASVVDNATGDAIFVPAEIYR